MTKPVKGTTDSWLIAAGIKTLPGTKQKKSRVMRGTRCAALSDMRREAIYQEIERIIQSDVNLTLKEIYQRLLGMGILYCKETDLLLTLGTVGRFVADVRVKLGLSERRAELKARFAKLKESGMKKSRIMNELSISVYSYDFLLRKYSKSKKEEN